MIKKIFTTVFLIGFIAVLVFGAVNRTTAKSENESRTDYQSDSQNSGQGKGYFRQAETGDETQDGDDWQNPEQSWRNEGLPEHAEGSLGEKGQGGGQGQGRGQGQGGGQSQGGGQGQGRGQGQGGGQAAGQTDTAERLSYQAVVTVVDAELITLTLENNELIEIEGRTLRLMAEEGFALQAGDLVSLVGFYDANDVLEIAEITNLSSGETLVVRGAGGRPVWAGRGNN